MSPMPKFLSWRRQPIARDGSLNLSSTSLGTTTISAIHDAFITQSSSFVSTTSFDGIRSDNSSSGTSVTLSSTTSPSDSSSYTSTAASVTTTTTASSSLLPNSPNSPVPPSSSFPAATNTSFASPTSAPSFLESPSSSTESTSSVVSVTSSLIISSISSVTAVISQPPVTETTSSSTTDTVASSTLSISSPVNTDLTSAVFTPTSSVSISTSATSKSEALSASSSNRFWSNKAMVAGTFTAVAVMALAVLVGACLFIRKKRRSSRYKSRNFSEKSFMDSEPRPYSASPSVPGSHDFTHEPMDGNDYREYPMLDPFSVQNALYSGNASLPEITYSYAQDVNNQYPYYGDEANNVNMASSGTTSTPALPTRAAQNPFEPVQNPFEPQPTNTYVDTSRIPGRTLPTPNQFYEPALRDSSTYQPSLDSFYGTSTAEPSSGQAL